MSSLTEENSSVIDIRRNRLRSSLILELYQSGHTSINRMARLFHASIPLATTIVNDLMKEGWIHETGTEPVRAGRPPVLYGLNARKYLTLVLDINRHDTHMMVFDLSNELIAEQQIDLKLEDSPAFMDQLLAAARGFVDRTNLKPDAFWGVGVSMPGLINVARGINQTYPHLTEPGLSLSDKLEAYFGLPVVLVNDTHATTIGEHRFGLAKDKKHVLTVNLDWGVGLGILLNSEVFNGATGFAGELGHIQVQPDGLLCHCGKIGCLDTLVSGFALIRQAQAGIDSGRATKLPKDAVLHTHHIIEAARTGDELSIDVLRNLGRNLGKGLATAVHLFNPEVVIVTGVLAEAGQYIADPIEQAINKYCLVDFRESLSIKISQLGNKARRWGIQAHLIDYLVAGEFS